MTERDQLIHDEIEDSERTRDMPPPEGSRGLRKNREASVVYSLRLSSDLIAELNQLSKQLDVPVSALIRGFVMDGLAAHHDGDGDLRSALDRLEHDVLEVRRKALPA
jgi:hypothetical protein